VKADGVKGEGGHSEERRSEVRRATGRRGFTKDRRCEQEEESKHSAGVECRVVLFRTLSNYIERQSNRRQSCPPTLCHSAELDGTDVGDDLMFLGAPLVDDVRLGWGCQEQLAE
jgi:hypothetical protein